MKENEALKLHIDLEKTTSYSNSFVNFTKSKKSVDK